MNIRHGLRFNPCAASTTNNAPRHAARLRETHMQNQRAPVYQQVQLICFARCWCNAWSPDGLDRDPALRSRSIESRSWSCFSRSWIVPVRSATRSDNVVLAVIDVRDDAKNLRVNSIAMKAPLCERAAIGSFRVKLAAFYRLSLRGFLRSTFSQVMS